MDNCQLQVSFFELMRTYYYDAIVDKQEIQTYNEQQKYFDSFKHIDHLEIRLGRLKKDGSGKYRQKGVDTLIAIDMLAKAYSNHYDVAILLAGDEDFLDVVTAVKNAGRQVYGAFFTNHISEGLRDSFDKRIALSREWMDKIRKLQ